MSVIGNGNVHGFHWTKELAVDYIWEVTRVEKEELEKMSGKALIKLAVEIKVLITR
jgi:hypothetical protein